jgi:hypothetical protein
MTLTSVVGSDLDLPAPHEYLYRIANHYKHTFRHQHFENMLIWTPYMVTYVKIPQDCGSHFGFMQMRVKNDRLNLFPSLKSVIWTCTTFMPKGIIVPQKCRLVCLRQSTNIQTQSPGDQPTIPCPHCDRLFRARVGLRSHLRTHTDK